MLVSACMNTYIPKQVKKSSVSYCFVVDMVFVLFVRVNQH